MNLHHLPIIYIPHILDHIQGFKSSSKHNATTCHGIIPSSPCHCCIFTRALLCLHRALHHLHQGIIPSLWSCSMALLHLLHDIIPYLSGHYPIFTMALIHLHQGIIPFSPISRTLFYSLTAQHLISKPCENQNCDTFYSSVRSGGDSARWLQRIAIGRLLEHPSSLLPWLYIFHGPLWITSLKSIN